jgi:hypothetical protein
MLKKYITEETYQSFRKLYKECIRMLNGLKKKLASKLPHRERRWQVDEAPEEYVSYPP